MSLSEPSRTGWLYCFTAACVRELENGFFSVDHESSGEALLWINQSKSTESPLMPWPKDIRSITPILLKRISTLSLPMSILIGNETWMNFQNRE